MSHRHTLFCDICEIDNYPCVSIIDNYTINKRLVCRSCMLNTIKTIKKEKLKWYLQVKSILLKKLYNNESSLVNNIFEYVGIPSEKEIKEGYICSYCSGFMHDFHHDMDEPFYYYICGTCLL